MASTIGGNYENRLWVLVDLDHGDEVVGQFFPQDLTKTVETEIAESPSLGRQDPFTFWLNGSTETITFRARIWNQYDNDVTASEMIERLERLTKKNEDIGRIPVCNFGWGFDLTLTMDCLVKSIGGVTYDEIRPDGSIRGATLQITLVRYSPATIKATDPTVPESQTRIRRAKAGDTYESIFRDEYGDPLLGTVARQYNPRIPGMPLADLRPLDPVHVYDEDWLRRKALKPQFHAFQSGRGADAAAARRRELFDLRSADAFGVWKPDGIA